MMHYRRAIKEIRCHITHYTEMIEESKVSHHALQLNDRRKQGVTSRITVE